MIAELIGKPWRAEAAGPAAFDCKGLVRHVQREIFGRDVPELLYPAQTTDWRAVRASVARGGWHRTHDAPLPGDVLVCYGIQGAHVGVFVQYHVLGVLHSVGPDVSNPGVRFNTLDELLAGGYARPEVWRHDAAE